MIMIADDVSSLNHLKSWRGYGASRPDGRTLPAKDGRTETTRVYWRRLAGRMRTGCWASQHAVDARTVGRSVRWSTVNALPAAQ